MDGLDPRLLRSFAMDGDVCEGQAPSEQMDTDCNQDDRESLIREELVKEQLLREELLRQQAAIREQKASRNNAPTVSSVVAPKRPGSPSSFLEVRPPKGKILNIIIISNNQFLSRSWSILPLQDCHFSKPFLFVAAPSTQVKNSTTERCLFWPTCKNGEKCEFYHPTVPCK